MGNFSRGESVKPKHARLAVWAPALEVASFSASPIADPTDPRCGLIPGQPIQVLRIGDILARDGRLLRVTAADCEKLVTDGRDLKQDLAILYEHGEDPTCGYEAAGWIDPSSFEVRGDGLWATRVFWTADGYDAVSTKKRRYVSPHFFSELDAEGFIRPTRWIEITVTNTPAIPGMASIAASVRGGSLFFDESNTYPTYPDNAPDSGGRKEREPMKFSAETLKLLGLADGASQEDIEKAVSSLFTAKVEAEKKVASIPDTKASIREELAAEREALRAQVREEFAAERAKADRATRVAALLSKATADGKVVADNREAMSALAGSDPDAFERLLPSFAVLAPVTRVIQPGASTDVLGDDTRHAIDQKARAYRAEQLKAGAPVTYEAAVKHITAKKVA